MLPALEFHRGTLFPVLTGSVLPLVREAIAGCETFVEMDRGTYLAFDYRSSRHLDARIFPDPKLARGRVKFLHALRRECRGLLLCS